MYFVLCQGGKLKCFFFCNFARISYGKVIFVSIAKNIFPEEYEHDPVCASGETPKTSYVFLCVPRNTVSVSESFPTYFLTVIFMRMYSNPPFLVKYSWTEENVFIARQILTFSHPPLTRI
jgi:hypothetical protein